MFLVTLSPLEAFGCKGSSGETVKFISHFKDHCVKGTEYSFTVVLSEECIILGKFSLSSVFIFIGMCLTHYFTIVYDSCLLFINAGGERDDRG